jgi:hypothetical protein
MSCCWTTAAGIEFNHQDTKNTKMHQGMLDEANACHARRKPPHDKDKVFFVPLGVLGVLVVKKPG